MLLAKLENYELSDSQIKNGLKKALLGSIELSGYAKYILERNGNTTLSLGLYSFAIGEYGKYEIIREFLSESVKRHHIPKVIFDVKNFKINFKKALDTLPRSITENLSNDLSLDLQSKMSYFNLTWDQEKEKWNAPPKIDSSLLSESLISFEKHVSVKLDSEYDS